MPLSKESPGDVSASSLTRDELADIPTTKVPVALSPETVLPQDATIETPSGKPRRSAKEYWREWYTALKKILPVYISVHLALIAISCLAFLFINHDFASKIMRVSTLWTQWHHWDTGNYMQIAWHGYVKKEQMAFFPLYPLSERIVMVITGGDPFIAGLLVSNMAELIAFTVLYRLVAEDFGDERAYYTILYLAIFPTAFFFSIGYTESLFFCFSSLAFYQMRHARWWFAGLFGALATLTRPDGLFLIAPFCYEYLRRRWPQEVKSLRAFLTRKQIFALIASIRFDVLICLCIPAGLLLYMALGRYQFGDPLSFVHSEDAWGRHMTIPGYGMVKAMWAIRSHSLMSFTGMRSLTDLIPDMLVGLLVLLCFVGPWRLSPKLWSYGLYALILYIYFQLFTRGGTFPLESMSRFMLEPFAAFILLSNISKSRLLHQSYCMVSFAAFFFLSTQFATGHWVL